jgi:hypothetical protein
MCKAEICASTSVAAGHIGLLDQARLALDCDKGGAKAAPTMLYWLHIPKCGSTFANTVVHALCDGVPANASEANFLGKTPDFIKGRSCPRLAVPVRAGWGRHDDLSAWLLAEVGGADRVVALLREPQARAEAAWNHVNIHGDRNPKGPPADNARQFAEATAGCMARTLAGRGTCSKAGRRREDARRRDRAAPGPRVRRRRRALGRVHLPLPSPVRRALPRRGVRAPPVPAAQPHGAARGAQRRRRRLRRGAPPLRRGSGPPERCAALCPAEFVT